MRWRLSLLTLSLLCAATALRAMTISIEARFDAQRHTAPRLALADFTSLLDSACHCIVTPDSGQPPATVRIHIQEPSQERPADPFAAGKEFPYFHYPAHGFTWYSVRQGNGDVDLMLTAPGPQGLANGLYALLQEKLGFAFIHARQTLIPELDRWPIIGDWAWEGAPRFAKKGFHLHTMHPLELTEPLHDPDYPGGAAMVEEYLLWLARNGQNYVDFSLMEDVEDDLDRWVTHAARFTRYAHDRGILCGIDISLHMLQQKSYQLVKFPPADFRPYEEQVASRLRRLMHANWDFINLEFALAEFVGGMESLRDRLRDAVLAEMAHYPQTKLIGRQHVVKPENEMGGSHSSGSLSIPHDPRMGILVHTVMCYALTDKRAPVYELQDFSHLYRMLEEQNKVRETWYYPESAYWITFDNSIPLLLLPYLNARFRDIETCQSLGVPGHVTFTSGWEWGYWLVDWSIARWSWDYEGVIGDLPDAAIPRGPYQYLLQFFPDPAAASIVTSLADRQQSWLIEQDLLRWLCPSNPTDELPAPLNKQFQPRGFANLGMLGRAAARTPDLLPQLPVDSLRAFADWTLAQAGLLRDVCAQSTREDAPAPPLACELVDGLRVVALRALHSAQLMEAAQAYAHSNLSKQTLRTGIAEAAGTRRRALAIVREQEARYRYPLPQLAGKYPSHTAYDFGYLYPVHALHFWEREERQMLRGRKGPFFMNIYDLARIAGLRD